ncbi:MAG: hypothetical protein IJE71_05010, partial [Clostridia bacterium]|nr:hypothetical protein [Clostridia bacterium]
KICTAYENTLKGVYHQRIEYPSVDLNRARRQSQKRQDQKQQEQALQAEKTEEKAPEEKA